MFLFKKKPVQKAQESQLNNNETYGDNEEEVLKNIREKLRSPAGKVIQYQTNPQSINAKENDDIDMHEDDNMVEDEIAEEETDEIEEEVYETEDEIAEEETDEIEEKVYETEDEIAEEETDEIEEEVYETEDEIAEEETDEIEEEVYETEDEHDEIDDIITNNAKIGLEKKTYDDSSDYEPQKSNPMDRPESQHKNDYNLINDSVKQQTQNYIGELLATANATQKQNIQQQVQDITLVSLVAPVIREHVKVWLNDNLASLVNNIVKAEIKKLLPDEYK